MITKEKELIIVSENKQYNLKLYILSDIYLEIEEKEKEKMTNEIYFGNFSLKNLLELSKIFRFCDNLDEAFDTIVSIYESKKNNIK